jgi:hypothetical protein
MCKSSSATDKDSLRDSNQVLKENKLHFDLDYIRKKLNICSDSQIGRLGFSTVFHVDWFTLE